MKTNEDRMEEAISILKQLIAYALAKFTRNKLNVLNTREAVLVTGLSRQTLYLLRKSGMLRYSLVGGRIIYEACELERLVREHRVPLMELVKAARQKGVQKQELNNEAGK